jgi:hypothetical protein
MGSKQSLEQHKEHCKALVAERHALLQQQANLLRGYIMAGQPLPVSAAGVNCSCLQPVDVRADQLRDDTQLDDTHYS